MTLQKYLLAYGSPADASAHVPSQEEMQQLYAQWTAWKDKFKTEIIDLGDGLKPGGKVVRQGATSDGRHEGDNTHRAAGCSALPPVLTCRDHIWDDGEYETSG